MLQKDNIPVARDATLQLPRQVKRGSTHAAACLVCSSKAVFVEQVLGDNTRASRREASASRRIMRLALFRSSTLENADKGVFFRWPAGRRLPGEKRPRKQCYWSWASSLDCVNYKETSLALANSSSSSTKIVSWKFPTNSTFWFVEKNFIL